MQISSSAKCSATRSVHAFVAAADEQDLSVFLEAVGGGLIEQAALGRKQHDFLIGTALRPDGLDGGKNGLALEDHAFSAAERTVVHGAMAIVGPGAEIVDADVEQAVGPWRA